MLSISLTLESTCIACRNGTLFYNILDKETGKSLGRYELPAYFSWHNVNAWENKTHVMLDTHLQADARALNGFVGTINVYQWQGKFVRVTMPNPRAAGAARTGAASITPLSSARDVSCEFGTVHPGHMWQR